MATPPKREINKLAAPPPGRPVSRGPAPVENPVPPTEAPKGERPLPGKVPTRTVPTGPAGGSGSTLAEVKKMQQAILNLADVASSTDVTSMTGNTEGNQTGAQTRQIPGNTDTYPNVGEENKGYLSDKEQHELSESTKDDKKYLGGSDAFGKFLVQNYIPKDSFIGRQYLNVDVSGQKNRENASMMPANLRGIIDSIKRVGSPNARGEKTVDGIWQNRTNNALHVIGDLVGALLSFTKDMNINIPGYSEKDLQAFKERVPASWKDLKNVVDTLTRAKELTPHLVAMTEFLRNLNAKILNNKTLRKFIDQKESFVKYPQVEIPSNMRAVGIPGVRFNWIQNPAQNWISLNELSSLENFKGFLRRNRISDQDPESIKKVLDMVAQKINSVGTNEPGY